MIGWCGSYWYSVNDRFAISLHCHADEILQACSSLLFLSRPRSEGWPRHGRTFSVYFYSLSFWLTLPHGVLSTSWCCLFRPCVVFLACVHLTLFLALFLSPGNSLVSSWQGHSMLASLLWQRLTLYSSYVENTLTFFAVHETRRIFLSPFILSGFHSRTWLQATPALSLALSSLKSVCCEFSIFSAVMPR